MKFAIALLLSLSAFSVFAEEAATDIYSTVEGIEKAENAKCTEGDRSFALCSGAALPGPRGGFGHGYGRMSNSLHQTCLYSVKFDCVAASGNFELKLRVKEFFSNERGV